MKKVRGGGPWGSQACLNLSGPALVVLGLQRGLPASSALPSQYLLEIPTAV